MLDTFPQDLAQAEVEKKEKIQFAPLYPDVIEYCVLEGDKIKKKKFNYHASVNSSWQKIQKQLEVQIQQALLKGVTDNE